MAKIQIFGNILSYATPSASGDLVPKWYVDAMAENPGQTTMTIMTGTSIAPTQTGQVFYKEVTANTAFTLNASGLSAVNNEVCEFYLVINSSGNTVTLPSGWVWAGGSAPTIAEGTSIIHVFTTNAKSTWRAELLGAFPALANRIVFTVTVPANTEIDLSDQFYDTTLSSPVTADWGDGTTNTFAVGNITHTYTSAGTYQIRCSSTDGKMPVLGFSYLEGYLESVDWADVEWYSKENYSTTDLVDVGYMFWQCSNLSRIPASLFARNSNIGNFTSCFQGTGLEEIPPELFSTNDSALCFSFCFAECENLESIPSGLFDGMDSVTNFDGCFADCTGLTSITSDIFFTNTSATVFSQCFAGCTSLVTVTESLFGNITRANFSRCFYRCSSLVPLSSSPYVIQLWEKDGNQGNYSGRDTYSNTSATVRSYVPDAWGGLIPEYNSSTTYSKGDWVWSAFGGVPKVYTYINDTAGSNHTPGMAADYWAYGYLAPADVFVTFRKEKSGYGIGNNTTLTYYTTDFSNSNLTASWTQGSFNSATLSSATWQQSDTLMMSTWSLSNGDLTVTLSSVGPTQYPTSGLSNGDVLHFGGFVETEDSSYYYATSTTYSKN